MPIALNGQGDTMSTKMAAIGCGYWGPNLIRNFNSLPDVELATICDLDEDRRNHMSALYSDITVTDDYMTIINDASIEAVSVATPVTTHFPIGKAVLEAGKHLFIEKPMCANAEESRELVRIAEEKNLQIMVGHIFLFVPAVRKVKSLIESGDLGDIHYVNIRRLNLGIFQKDANVVWDLAPHDIAMLNYLFDEAPLTVSATGKCYVQKNKDIEDVAFLTLEYPNNKLVSIHVSWLDPDKIRECTFVGSKQMLVYDDVSMTEKIKIFDKGVDIMPHYDDYSGFHLAYRHGDIVIPKIDQAEPLKIECAHFIDCINGKATPLSDGTMGLQVVEVLEKACISIKEGGKPQQLGS